MNGVPSIIYGAPGRNTLKEAFTRSWQELTEDSEREELILHIEELTRTAVGLNDIDAPTTSIRTVPILVVPNDPYEAAKVSSHLGSQELPNNTSTMIMVVIDEPNRQTTCILSLEELRRAHASLPASQLRHSYQDLAVELQELAEQYNIRITDTDIPYIEGRYDDIGAINIWDLAPIQRARLAREFTSRLKEADPILANTWTRRLKYYLELKEQQEYESADHRKVVKVEILPITYPNSRNDEPALLISYIIQTPNGNRRAFEILTPYMLDTMSMGFTSQRYLAFPRKMREKLFSHGVSEHFVPF